MTYLKISNEKLIEIIGIKATNYKSGTEGNFQMQDLGETFTSSSSPRMSPLQVSIPSSMAAAAASMMRPEVSLLCRGWRSPSQKTPLWLIQGPPGGSPASRGPLEVPLLLELEPLPPPGHHLSLFHLFFSLSERSHFLYLCTQTSREFQN